MINIFVFIATVFLAFILACQSLGLKDKPTVVFVTGDDEYHSREVMVPYAKKLEEDYGFEVIYISDEAPGADEAENHDPQPTVLPGAERIKEADLMVVFIRFRSWEPNSLKLFLDHFEAGKPAIGIRTTTHAFWQDRTFSPKYFGGHYKTHYTRRIVGQVDPDHADHPMARGVRRKFGKGEGPYVSTPFTEGVIPIVLSYGHNRESEGIGNDSFDSPVYPVAWAFNDRGARRAMITLGSDRVEDHKSDFMQNLFYNAVFWSLGYEVPPGGILAAGKDIKPIKETNPYEPVKQQVPAPPAYTPDQGWEVLFDGQDLSKWKHWDVSIPPRGIRIDRRANSEGPIDYTKSPARWKIENGSAIARVGYGDIITKNKYADYQLRLDYYIPTQPDWVTGEWRGNSGVYLNGSFEIAILNTYGQQPSDRSNGAIYRIKAPEVEASKPENQWQTLEVTFRGGKATVMLNGQMIHREVTLNKPTLYGFPAEKTGPIRLQAENSSVRFANIAIKPLN
jgi:hypothetical protein